MALRWGICGAGNISNDFVSALLSIQNSGHEIVCVAARSVDKAKTFADRFGIKVAYGSYDELAKNPNIDIVYIGVYHLGHVPLSKQMMKAGKHVLCEKPMAFSVSQVLEVKQVAKETKRFFMEGVWSRFFPVYQKIRQEIQSGSLGDIQLVTAKMCLAINHIERLQDPDQGGGCLLEIGIYPIQFANWVFNNEKPEKITAVGSISDRGVDEDGCIILCYKNGAKAVLSFSGKFHCPTNSASIHGTKGHIEVPSYIWCPPEAHLPSGTITNDLPLGPSPYNYYNCGGLRFQADYAKKCIEEGKLECEHMSFADSEAIYAISDEIPEAGWTQVFLVDVKPQGGILLDNCNISQKKKKLTCSSFSSYNRFQCYL